MATLRGLGLVQQQGKARVLWCMIMQQFISAFASDAAMEAVLAAVGSQAVRKDLHAFLRRVVGPWLATAGSKGASAESSDAVLLRLRHAEATLKK